ncbi:hypothetical protein DFH07DRAFT_808552 [Mycena maculata]|uniref:ADF-H domain-containing protein n=1 Tax=Mycena maculata TaxID=230809 RepID=A0AAD7JLI7_9AGAR|nr:hypothetical protein DFH07DRAFT_808552 [Mycena maculata]
MAVNLPDDALAAYEAIVHREANWLLLVYNSSVQPEVFHLHASGSDGLPELKANIDPGQIDAGQVFIAFYRDGNDGFILLNIIPESVSGVRRARALVHSRRIGVIFQAHQTSLTVDHLSNLTPKSIRQALATPDSVHVIQVDRAAAEPTDTANEMGQLADPPATSAPPQSKGSVFSLLRRKKKPEAEFAVEPFDLHLEDSEDAPPPPPPKDRGRRSFSYQPPTPVKEESFHPPMARPTPPRPLPQPITTRHRSNSDYSVVSHSSSSDDVVVVKPDPPPSRSPGMKKRSATLPSKWNADPVDPVERARRRMEAQRQREIEEEQALEEEVQRQAKIKAEKEALRREQEEEDATRRAALEEELQRVTAQRRRREEREREEEDRKQEELERKRKADRERRMEEHRRLEQWRQAQAAQAEEAAWRTEQARKKEEAERKKKIQQAGAKIKNATVELVTGWVTMQTGDSLVWRRRYFKFVGPTVFFYRSLKEKDTGQVLDQIDLRGQVRGLREWNEGYEDLKAIPFSFAVEFNGEREPWSMFSDSEEEKYKLLGLLHAANTAA